MTAGLPDRRFVSIAGWASFALLGWTGLLVPSLVRSIEHDFGQSDAGVGAFYLLFAVAYAVGSVAGGIATERIGRRPVLVGALVLQAAGLGAQAFVPDWFVFLLAGIPRGLGSGAVDGGAQGLFLDAFPDAPSRAMNVLHLFFSTGSLAAPLALATLVDAGVPWQSLMAVSGLVALVVAVPYAVATMPSGRHDRSSGTDARTAAAPGSAEATSPSAGVRVGLPLVLAGVAISSYVASEVGVSSWLVRFLAAAPLAVATGALSLFWVGLTLGRIAVARIGDRIEPIRLAIGSSLAAAVALAAAVVAPSVPLSIALFAVVGFAFGPIYPTIMLIGDRLYPGRAAAVTGLLAGVAVIGSVGYPPLMGAISVSAGLGVGMLGAAGLSVACGVLLVVAARARRSDA